MSYNILHIKSYIPVLSAQFMTAPTGKPRDIRNLAPAEPPRPEKSTFFEYSHNLLRGQPPWPTNACTSATEKRRNERQGVNVNDFGHTIEFSDWFDRRRTNNYDYNMKDETTYLFWTLWCVIRSRPKLKMKTTRAESRERCEHARDNLTTRQAEEKDDTIGITLVAVSTTARDQIFPTTVGRGTRAPSVRRNVFTSTGAARANTGL